MFGGRLCYCCNQPVKTQFCDDCLAQLKPTFNILPSFANICLGGYLYPYSDAVRFMMRQIKFRYNLRLAEWFRSQYQVLKIDPIFFDSDAIVYVRSHWFRQLFRGRAHLPYLFEPFLNNNDSIYFKYLTRIRYTSASYRLTRQERQVANLKPRFSWSGNKHIKSVTILDDICTTGATVTEIAGLLKSHGIDTVKVLVISYVTTSALKS